MTGGELASQAPSRTPKPKYRGRFAPSPTGPLHFGSLVAAMASFLDARHQGGEWLVRIEDLDPPREKAGSADDILRTLEAFGFEWDEAIERQSKRFEVYGAVVADLLSEDLAYHCSCSRKELSEIAPNGPEGVIYPGTCRGGPKHSRGQRAVRLLTHDDPIVFVDRIQDYQSQRVQSTIGDYVIRRADGYFAYQLAVVLDDAWQGITHVVRGADLLPSTPRQLHLQAVLQLPSPEYAHLPIVIDDTGRKLSKSDAAHPVDLRSPLETLGAALRFLGQDVPDTGNLRELWKETALQWDIGRVPRRLTGV